MKIRDILKEDGRIVKGVNTTVDVDVNQIPKEAGKFGNKVDKDGRPPTLSTKVKGKSTNVLFNLGLAESVNHKLFTEALGEIASSTEIYVDMDGVLADFFEVWAKIMGVDHWTDIPKQYNIEDALEKIRNTEDFWLNLPLTDNAKNLLNLIKQVKGSYKILSSPLANDPRCEEHKKEWVSKNLGFFPPQEVIISHNKAQYAKQADGTPNILIDDYGVNISAWEAAGGIGFKHKDHKFERTARNIKQHMQEPVEEGWWGELTANSIEDWAEEDMGALTEASKIFLEMREKYKNTRWEAQVECRIKSFEGFVSVKGRMPQDQYAEPLMPDQPEQWQRINPDHKCAMTESIEEGSLRIPTSQLRSMIIQMLQDMETQHDTAKLVKIARLLGKEVYFMKKGDQVVLQDPDFDFYARENIDALVKIYENFADGKKKGKSRPGRVKRSGASCKGSVTSLRKKAKKASGEKAKMYHWCANMKSGRKK